MGLTHVGRANREGIPPSCSDRKSQKVENSSEWGSRRGKKKRKVDGRRVTPNLSSISLGGTTPPFRGPGCWLQRGIGFRSLGKVLGNMVVLRRPGKRKQRGVSEL